jgi:hypothetical protein
MTATTWDPNNKAAGITLTGGSLIATAASGTNPAVLATRSISGPSYWEVTCTTLALTMAIGIACGRLNTGNGLLIGNDAVSQGVGFLNNGTVRLNNATLATIQTYAAGNVIGIAYNPQARLIWFRNDAGNWNNDVIGNQNPVGNVGGIDVSAMVLGTLYPAFAASTTTGAGTANFTGAFANAAPTGYITLDTLAAGGRAAELNTAGNTHDGPVRQDPVAGYNQVGAWLGGYGPLSGSLHIAGNVKELGVNAASKRVLLFDGKNGEKIGEVLSDASGNFTMPALGRATTIVIALDPTTYDALVFDRVIPL